MMAYKIDITWNTKSRDAKNNAWTIRSDMGRCARRAERGQIASGIRDSSSVGYVLQDHH